jgi:hypothetical protein
MKKLTYAQLERSLLELKAQSPLELINAKKLISKAGDSMMASAVIITITALGGREIVPAFAIYDGLSAESIVAIKTDIERTLTRVRG